MLDLLEVVQNSEIQDGVKLAAKTHGQLSQELIVIET